MRQFQNSFIALAFLMMIAMTLGSSIQTRLLEERILQETPAETEDQIIAKIDAKIKEKIAAVNERYTILSQVTTAGDEAKQLDLKLIDAKIAVEAAYRNYYNQRLTCDGLDGELDIVGTKGEIPTDQCLEFPIAVDAVNLFVQKNQLDGYVQDKQIAQKAFDIQTKFAADAKAESAIYKDLSVFFGQKGNATLQNKYSNQAFTSSNFAIQEQQKADLKKQILDGAAANQASGQTAVTNSENSLASKRSTCATNLNNLKNTLNTSLASAKSIKSQLDAKIVIVNNGFAQLATQLTKLKAITSELNALADKYSTIVAQ